MEHHPAEYGQYFDRFILGDMYQYPDFNLIYVGSKIHYSPNIEAPPATADFYLIIDHEGHRQEIKYSDGFGIVMPTKFQVNDQKFLLESSREAQEGYHIKKIS